MSETPKKTSPFFLRLFGSEILLGIMIALLSVMTALSAYQGALADSQESDANVEGQKVLSLSNTEFLRANQDIIQDYTMFDGFYINEERDPELADYYRANFSDALATSMDRPEGPFDDPYYDEMYLDADTSYDEAMTKFDEAQAAGDKANQFQLVVLVFAVALALVAWASVLKDDSNLRPVFTLLSLVISAYGAVNFIMLMF